MTEEQKNRIDNMDQFSMCRMWRFAKDDQPLLQGEAGDYFKKRLFEHFGGFTPAISKELGWSL